MKTIQTKRDGVETLVISHSGMIVCLKGFSLNETLAYEVYDVPMTEAINTQCHVEMYSANRKMKLSTFVVHCIDKGIFHSGSGKMLRVYSDGNFVCYLQILA